MSATAAEVLEEEAEAPVPSERAAALARLSPQHAALELAWPGIVENAIVAIGQAAIFSFVGHLGAAAIAGVGSAWQFLFLLFPVWRSLSIGTMAIVGRRMGEGRPEAAADATRQSLILGGIFGLLFGAMFVVLARPFLTLIGASDEVASVGVPFLALVGGFSVMQTTWLIGTSAMRAAGDSRTPMYLAITSVVVGVPLAYLAIDVLGLGPMGAAYASVVDNTLLLVLTFALLWRGRAELRLAGGQWRISGAVARSIMTISLPSAAESAVFSVGIIALSGLAFRLGTEAVAAHQIVGQVETFSFLPCIGFSGAASALVAQALGMRDPRRAAQAGWAAARMSAYWATAMGALFVIVPGFFLNLFTGDLGVVRAGFGALAIIGLVQPAQAVIFTLGGALRGAGDTRFTLAASIVNWFVVRFPLAALFAFPLHLGLAGIWAAVGVDYVVRAGLLAWRFRGGVWQRVAV